MDVKDEAADVNGREGYKKAAIDANKATKASLDVKEATGDVKYDLKASEDVKKSSRQPPT